MIPNCDTTCFKPSSPKALWKHLTVGWPPLHCVCELLNVNALTTIFCVSLQLGFGSFLGIIGAHLIENKRQMVRGFKLPLCAAIAPALCRGLAASTLTGTTHPSRLRLSPIDRSKGLIKLLTPWRWMQQTQCWCFSFFCFFFFLLKHVWVSILRQWGEMRPEIEKGCKRRTTDVQCGIWGRKL